MTAHALTRKSKALTIIPLALLSGAWTLNLVSTSASATATGHDHGSLPDGSRVPTKAIEAPASVPVPGTIAPGVPQGTADQVVAGASSSGIPSPALSAYQRAAQIIDSADKTCNIPWELIGAIGRVESDHGRYGGNTLTADGVSKPGIYGPELNGKNGTQLIEDTDGGQLDHDPVYDRAVGPMQFIPSTWSVVKVDADGDGIRNPQDIDDASLATAVYLCSGSGNLSTRTGQEAAVYRYNHSQDYVNLVLRIMEAYSQGDYTAVPAGTSGGTMFSPTSTAVASGRGHAAKVRAHKQHAHAAAGSAGSGSGTSTGSGSSGGYAGGGTGSTGASTGSGAGSTLGGTVGGVVGGITGSGGGGSSSTPTAAPTPVAQTLSAAEALTLCNQQLGAINPLLATVGGSACAGQVTGKTHDQALAIIPNTLSGAKAWLTKLGVTLPLGL